MQGVEVLRDCRDEFITIQFNDPGGETLVFRRDEMLAATDDILTDNGVRSRGSPDMLAIWMAYGIGVAFAGAVVQKSGVDLHPQFNHNDLYHLIQIGAMWLLYCAGLRLEDCSPCSQTLLRSAPGSLPPDAPARDSSGGELPNGPRVQ